ncbi:Pc22g25480 [Penicillium rubens Wisconsin 54-1255]|uniref:Pc22g25480 protein n=1 Tax=Penicillium rubens (strain ATCC 28089 / DSM 1075 / NRRL 1951 / Wisconsin 54-1255) TaxID=500485 RepID=B6HSI6_PENRW|nr:Pc22g25480 [Penicillium rubens Wisconsin 54-1255]
MSSPVQITPQPQTGGVARPSEATSPQTLDIVRCSRCQQSLSLGQSGCSVVQFGMNSYYCSRCANKGRCDYHSEWHTIRSRLFDTFLRFRLRLPGSRVPVRFCRLCWHSLLFIDRDLRIPMKFMEDYTGFGQLDVLV